MSLEERERREKRERERGEVHAPPSR